MKKVDILHRIHPVGKIETISTQVDWKGGARIGDFTVFLITIPAQMFLNKATSLL